jgi:hypothetical protein
MRPRLAGVGAAVVSGFLIAALLLGFAVTRGAVDPGFHGMASVVAAAFAIGSHVRRGGGWDLLAVVLLLATVALGTAANVGNGLVHAAVAIVATAVSVGLHLLPR